MTLVGMITDIHCMSCGSSNRQYVNLQDLNQGQYLCSCGSVMQIGKKPNHVFWGIDRTIGKYDLSLGCHVESSSHFRQLLKQNNCDIITGSRTASEQLKELRDRKQADRQASSERKLEKIASEKYREARRIKVY